MSIMDMFRNVQTVTVANPTTPAAPASAAPATGPGNMPATPPNPAAPGNGIVPANTPNPPAAPAAPVSPLDNFADLWKTDTNNTGSVTNKPMFNVDPAKLAEAAKKMNLASSVTPEQLQAIQAGGEGAAAAFQQAMESVASNVMVHAATASAAMVEQAVAKAQADFASQVPGLIKKANINNELLGENPALSHPAAQPLVEAIQRQVLQKFPNATPVELREQVNNYFNSFAEVITAPRTKAAATKTAKAGRGEQNWDAFLPS
jgi:hypothetical protein